jgi:hypothetical protein
MLDQSNGARMLLQGLNHGSFVHNGGIQLQPMNRAGQGRSAVLIYKVVSTATSLRTNYGCHIHNAECRKGCALWDGGEFFILGKPILNGHKNKCDC